MAEVEGVIAGLGGQGDGIMATARGPVYIRGAAPGDRVKARLTKPRGDGFAARLRQVIAPGADRVEPPCPHFAACGGCALQHLRADAYARWKLAVVVEALRRQGLGEAPVAPLVSTPAGARRRADFVARRVGDGVLIGFHEFASRSIVDIRECLVLAPPLVALSQRLRGALAAWLAPGESVDLKATLTDSGIELMVVSGRGLAGRERAALAAHADRQGLARLAWHDRRRRFTDIVSERAKPLVHFAGVPVALPPGAFLQASAAAEALLIAFVLEHLAESRRVVDLYAGCGTFSLPLAVAGKSVLAVDGDEAALAALGAAANDAGLAGRLRWQQRDLQRQPLNPAELAGFDAALFDPPRSGAKIQAGELARSSLATVVGVSCDPVTFARDARLLAAGGFRLAAVQPIDQFVWAAQVELVGVFRR